MLIQGQVFSVCLPRAGHVVESSAIFVGCEAQKKKRRSFLSLFSLFSLSACVRTSAGITAATQVGWCGDDDNEVNELLTCGGPKQSTKGPPASGSTCKTSIQCVKTWLSQKIELFAVIMTLFLFLET
jgi:hypothetical protein